MRVISDASLLLGAITPRSHYTAAAAEHREEEEGEEMGKESMCGICPHFLSPVLPFPSAREFLCLSVAVLSLSGRDHRIIW